MVPPGAFVHTAAFELARVIREAIAGRGRATAALSGGTTPRPIYQDLATGHQIPWERVQLYFGDERAVPPDDAASNYRMARDTLLAPSGIPAANVHRIAAEGPSLDQAARAYQQELPPRLDLLILGIGSDGHTASLFPGSPAVEERTRLVVAVRGPTPPHDRITITPPVIAQAGTVVLLAQGAAKAAAVERALSGGAPPTSCPAVLAARGLWILDEAAAGRPGGGVTGRGGPGEGGP